MTVSVIIPSYNRYELLCRAIASVKAQAYTNCEIIVVDDCSTELQYKHLANDSSIRYLRLNDRSGLPAAVRNIGIRHANGTWIAFLDDDDTWLPNKLSQQMKWADEYELICSDAYCTGKLLNAELNAVFWQNYMADKTVQLNYKMICNHNFIINSSVIIKKEVLEDVGLMPEEPIYKGVEDYMTWLEVLKNNYPCLFLSEALVEYNNTSYKHYLTGSHNH